MAAQVRRELALDVAQAAPSGSASRSSDDVRCAHDELLQRAIQRLAVRERTFAAAERAREHRSSDDVSQR